MGKKYALLIVTTEYRDGKLSALPSTGDGHEEFARALRDPAQGGCYRVDTLVNASLNQILPALDRFFAHKTPSDVLVVYFSGLGVIDAQGDLFLALKDTGRYLLKSSALRAEALAASMDLCPSPHKVLILDARYFAPFPAERESGIPALVAPKKMFAGKGIPKVIFSASDRVRFPGKSQVAEARPTGDFSRALAESLVPQAAGVETEHKFSVDDWWRAALQRMTAAKLPLPARHAVGNPPVIWMREEVPRAELAMMAMAAHNDPPSGDLLIPDEDMEWSNMSEPVPLDLIYPDFAPPGGGSGPNPFSGPDAPFGDPPAEPPGDAPEDKNPAAPGSVPADAPAPEPLQPAAEPVAEAFEPPPQEKRMVLSTWNEWDDADARARLMTEEKEAAEKARLERAKPRSESSRLDMMTEMQKTLFVPAPEEEAKRPPQAPGVPSPAAPLFTADLQSPPRNGSVPPAIDEWEEADIRARLLAENKETEDKARRERLKPRADVSRLDMMAEMTKTLFVPGPEEEAKRPLTPTPAPIPAPAPAPTTDEWAEAEIRARLMAEGKAAEEKARQERRKSRGEVSRVEMMAEMQKTIITPGPDAIPEPAPAIAKGPAQPDAPTLAMPASPADEWEAADIRARLMAEKKAAEEKDKEDRGKSRGNQARLAMNTDMQKTIFVDGPDAKEMAPPPAPAPKSPAEKPAAAPEAPMTPVILPTDHFFAAAARRSQKSPAPRSQPPAKVRPPVQDHPLEISHNAKRWMIIGLPILAAVVALILAARSQHWLASLKTERPGAAGAAPASRSLAPAPPAGVSAGVGADAILKSSLRAALAGDAAYLQTIYKLHAGNMPNLSGKMVISLKVDTTGAILESAILSSTTGAAPFDQDVLRTVKGWKLQPFPGPGPKLISIPLRFPMGS